MKAQTEDKVEQYYLQALTFAHPNAIGNCYHVRSRVSVYC